MAVINTRGIRQRIRRRCDVSGLGSVYWPQAGTPTPGVSGYESASFILPAPMDDGTQFADVQANNFPLQGLGDLSSIPTWAWVAGAAAFYWFFLRKGR